MCNLYCFVLQVFEGNNDSTTIVTHPLNSTERTRFVRFYPTTYDNNACIRVELHGQEIVKSKLVKLQTELFSLELEIWLISLTFERCCLTFERYYILCFRSYLGILSWLHQHILAILVEAFKESCKIYLIYRVLKNIKLVFCIEICEKTAIDENPPDVVVTSLPKMPPSESGTELWCWSSNSPEPYLKVDFRAYCIICALQVSFNGIVEISYGNKSLNKSQVYT